MTADELRAKFPNWKIHQDPDPNCRCKGVGFVRTKSGLEAPCMCACFSMPHGEPKQELMRAIGNAASNALKEFRRDSAR